MKKTTFGIRRKDTLLDSVGKDAADFFVFSVALACDVEIRTEEGYGEDERHGAEPRKRALRFMITDIGHYGSAPWP
jgi:hypothetical protein